MMTHIIINIMIQYVNQLTNFKYVVLARSFRKVLMIFAYCIGRFIPKPKPERSFL